MVRLPNVPASNGLTSVSPITRRIDETGTCNSSSDCLRQRGANVLAHLNFACVDRNRAIFVDVYPRTDLLRQLSIKSTTGFALALWGLGQQVTQAALSTRDAAAKYLHELAPIKIELILMVFE